MYCEKCGKGNPDFNKFCLYCGNELKKQSYEKKENAIKSKCSKCGKINADGSNFCELCGNKLAFDNDVPNEKNICSACGAENNNGAKFCNKCGENLNATLNNTSASNSTQIIGEIIFIALGLVVVGIAIYYFNLAHETLYTYNGISRSEAPKFTGIAWICLTAGLVSVVWSIINIYNKLKNK